MRTDQIVFACLGALFAFASIGLCFARIDQEASRSESRTDPFLALYRFPAFRYGLGLVSLVAAVLASVEAYR